MQVGKVGIVEGACDKIEDMLDVLDVLEVW
jgi:hypothetical protein